MATADHVKALIRSHAEGDDERFYAIAMQVAAQAARQGHTKFAQELRDLVDQAKARVKAVPAGQKTKPVPIIQPRGELAGLLTASFPKNRLSDMALDEAIRSRIDRILLEQRQRETILSHGMSPLRKLLLVGPPGTGKTMTAAALAGELPTLGPAFVVLGTGDPKYQDLWRQLAAEFPDRIGTRIGFDERLAHLIEAGADIFLMPSHFEPCGLNQMYSLRYGTVPVVRSVGGLADTVTDEAATSDSARPNGFTFVDYRPEALLAALKRALLVFQNQNAWRELQTAGMQADHSWHRSAGEYVKIYDWAVSKGEMNGR